VTAARSHSGQVLGDLEKYSHDVVTTALAPWMLWCFPPSWSVG